jgi:type I restriction enzyme S subunit
MAKEYFIKDFLKRIKRPIELNGDEEYKLVTIKMNHNGVILRERKKGCDIKSNMYIVHEGDFILSGIDARNGAFGIIPPGLDGAIVTNDFWYFDLEEDIISKELFLEITSTGWFDEICKKGSDGTTQRIRLQKDKFFNQKIWLPEKDEQKIILEKIRSFKSKFKILSKQIEYQQELLQKFKQAILQDAIQGKLTADWREQNPDVESASELLKRIKAEKTKLIKEKKIKKEKPLPPIKGDKISYALPEDWTWCYLGDICSKTGSGSTPRGGKSVYTSSGIKFIRSQNVYDSSLILEDIVFISESTHKSMSGTKVIANDLLLNITGGSIGRCCQVPNDFDEANINQHVAIIRVIQPILNSIIHMIICSPYFQNKIIEAQTGAGREGLPKNKMDIIPIPLPPFIEQQIIVEKVESLLGKCNQLSVEIENQRKYSQYLQKALFNEVFELKEKNTQEKTTLTETKSKAQTISSKPTNIDYYKRSVLAAEIVWQLHKEPTLGHLKLQKLIFLCQKTGNMQLHTNFLRQAMGPYDNQLMRSVDKQLKDHKWFEYNSAEKLKYQLLEKAGEHHADYLKYFSEESSNIQFIIDTFKLAKSNVVEIVATLYACMENILEEKNIIYSESLLIQRFYEWSEEKQKFSEEEVQSVLKRMKEIGIVPDGLKN